MPIESRMYPAADLTAHEVSGDFTEGDIRETLRSFYKETGPTLFVLWDMRKVVWDLVPVTSILTSLLQCLRIYQEEMEGRRGGRTAIVVDHIEHLTLPALVKYLLENLSSPPPFEIEAFVNMASAHRWLSEPRSSPSILPSPGKKKRASAPAATPPPDGPDALLPRGTPPK